MKYGFVYIWFDTHHKMYYVGCHWGTNDDGYICSSPWMKRAFKKRPHHFKRRVIKTNLGREEMYIEEQRYFDMIKPHEFTTRYYNIKASTSDLWHKYPAQVKTIGQKISAAKLGKKVGPQPQRGAAISAAKKGKTFSAEHKAALSEAARKRKMSPENKAKKTEELKLQWATGKRSRTNEGSKQRWVEYREGLNTTQ
jgi:hypothetical protein